MSYESTTALQCPHCEHEIDGPDDLTGPVYECSKCGTTEVVEPGERARCGSCNVFMAKQTPASCPQCAEGLDVSELEPVERYGAADGSWHETAAAAAKWDRETPARLKREAKQAAASDARLAQHMADHARETADRVRRLQAAAERCPVKLAYYSGPSVFTWESHEAHITPAEFFALAGTEDDTTARTFAAAHNVWLPFEFEGCVSFGVQVEALMLMMQAAAGREPN